MRSYYWNQSYSADLTIKSLRPAVELKEEYIKTDIKKTLDLLDEENRSLLTFQYNFYFILIPIIITN